MSHDRSSLEKYYGKTGLTTIETKALAWTADQQAALAAEMKQLWDDAKAVAGTDPAGDPGQAIATRWIESVERFTGGDPDLMDGLERFYANRSGWPVERQEYWAERIRPEVWDFVAEAISIRRRRTAITVFATIGCTTCEQAKAFLRAQGVRFIERDVAADADAMAQLMAWGCRALPVIAAGDGRFLQGFDEIALRVFVASSARVGRP